MLCGTDPYPKDFKAKKYKLERHALSKEDFTHIMKNLPVPVEDEVLYTLIYTSLHFISINFTKHTSLH